MQSFKGHNGLGISPVQVIDAFSIPFVEFDMIRKLFHYSESKRKVLADAKVRVRCATRLLSSLLAQLTD